jgi:hypothetical protein
MFDPNQTLYLSPPLLNIHHPDCDTYNVNFKKESECASWLLYPGSRSPTLRFTGLAYLGRPIWYTHQIQRVLNVCEANKKPSVVMLCYLWEVTASVFLWSIYSLLDTIPSFLKSSAWYGYRLVQHLYPIHSFDCPGMVGSSEEHVVHGMGADWSDISTLSGHGGQLWRAVPNGTASLPVAALKSSAWYGCQVGQHLLVLTVQVLWAVLKSSAWYGYQIGLHTHSFNCLGKVVSVGWGDISTHTWYSFQGIGAGWK